MFRLKHDIIPIRKDVTPMSDNTPDKSIGVGMNLSMDDNAKDTVDNLIKPAYSVSQTLDDLWYLFFGKFSNFIAKKRQSHQKDLEDFRDTLYQKVKEIPEDRSCEPKLSVIGPALECSKYYIEEEDLRELFSNLIAHSFDSFFETKVHPSYVEIIKQLSPLDAKLLQNDLLYHGTLPVAKVRQQKKQETLIGDFDGLNYFSNMVDGIDIIDPFYVSSVSTDTSMLCASLLNLSRLGILRIGYDQWLAPTVIYKEYEDSSQFKDVLNEHEKSKQSPPGCFLYPDDNIYLIKGMLETTRFGQNFIQTCCAYQMP